LIWWNATFPEMTLRKKSVPRTIM